MKSVVQRLNNLSGQLEGIKTMIEKENDCIKILTQLKALRSGVDSIMDLLMEQQFDLCIENSKKFEKNKLLKIKKLIIK